MELNILLKIAIIFLFFTAVDICGHFIFKTKRNVPEWLLTIGVVLAFAGTTFLGVRSYFDDTDTNEQGIYCLLYTSPSPRDLSTSRMPSSA